MTTIRCQTRGCLAQLDVAPPAAETPEAAVRALVEHLIAQGWSVIEQHIACPGCTKAAEIWGITWDNGSRTAPGLVAAAR